jgi:hypothetical protein
MAKQTGKAGGNSRFRLIVLEGEIGEGNSLGEFVNAMQQALKPPQTVIQRITAPNNGKTAPAEGAEIDAEADTIFDEAHDEDPIIVSRAPRQRRTSPKMPKVINIDMNADVSLATFAQGKDASSQHKKYLIAAAWLAEHRDTPAVTEDHIFTCFKSIGWSLNIRDFAQPLRELKTKRQFFEQTERGYEINHLGLDYVKKLGNGAG